MQHGRRRLAAVLLTEPFFHRSEYALYQRFYRNQPDAGIYSQEEAAGIRKYNPPALAVGRFSQDNALEAVHMTKEILQASEAVFAKLAEEATLRRAISPSRRDQSNPAGVNGGEPLTMKSFPERRRPFLDADSAS